MKPGYIDPQNHLLEDKGFIDAISDYIGRPTDSAPQTSSNTRRLDDLYSDLGGTSSELESNVRDSIGKSVNQEEASFLQNILRSGLDMLPDSVRSSIIDVGTDIVLDQASEEELERMVLNYASGLSSEDLIRIATSQVSEMASSEVQEMLRAFVVSMDKDQLVDLIQTGIDSGLVTDDQILDVGLDYIA